MSHLPAVSPTPDLCVALTARAGSALSLCQLPSVLSVQTRTVQGEASGRQHVQGMTKAKHVQGMTKAT